MGLCALLSAVLVSVASVRAAGPAAVRFDELLAVEVGNGTISREVAAAYAYYARFDREMLPQRYVGAEASPLRCATDVVRSAKAALGGLPAEERTRLENSMDRATPCGQLASYPYSITSAIRPITVHYAQAGDAAEAANTLAYAEQSWQLQVEEMGFDPPLSDNGACGNDANFDIFLEHGLGYAYVQDIADNPATSWDDYACFMVIDPDTWGGIWLKSTVAHEFNHALQAANDWWELGASFEASSTLMEDVVDDPLDYYFDVLADFNRRSHRPFEYNNDSFTYFVYGGVMQMLFYRDRYFGGDASFLADFWYQCRSTARGGYTQPQLNEPDLNDAFETILQQQAGVTHRDAVVEFSRWRWFVGSHDDGQHFEEGGLWPDGAQVRIWRQAEAANLPVTLTVTDGPLSHGVQYLRLATNGAESGLLCATFTGVTDVDWHVESMRRGPQVADAWFFELDDDGTFDVELGGTDEVIFKVLNLADASYDPDYLSSASSSYALELAIDGQCATSAPADADYDDDGQVDLSDYVLFSSCLSGPADAPGFVAPDQRCRNAFDFERDGDVDVADFGGLQERFDLPSE